MARHLDLLWTRLSEIYGHKLTSTYGDSIPGAWCDQIKTMTADNIKQGLECCATSVDPWPPSLPQFVSWCLGGKDGKSAKHCTAAYRVTPKSHQLPEPTDPEKARQAMASMSEILKGVKAPVKQSSGDFAATRVESLKNNPLTDAEAIRRDELIKQADSLQRQKCDGGHG